MKISTGIRLSLILAFLGAGSSFSAPRSTQAPAAKNAKAVRGKPGVRKNIRKDAGPDLFTQTLQTFLEDEDYLGLRIFLKKYALNKKKTKRSWYITRRVLDVAPQAGFDLLYVWKHISPLKRTPLEVRLQNQWQNAQQLMLRKKFSASVDVLTGLATEIRGKLSKLEATQKEDVVDLEYENITIVYPYILHSLGRALFGAGRFAESAEVYSWIPSGYAGIRQVLFEKMWAAYRAGDAGGALAAIASQKSAYFSPFLEPEAYLLQIYLYKRLCRSNELENVLKELHYFRDSLKDKSFSLVKWAGWDMESLTLLRLLKKNNYVEKNGISKALRHAEGRYIYSRLKKLYAADVNRLNSQISKVIAFSGMAVLSNTSSQLKPIKKLASRAELLKSSKEIWPYDKGEEWLDEIGTQHYLGGSQCADVK